MMPVTAGKNTANTTQNVGGAVGTTARVGDTWGPNQDPIASATRETPIRTISGTWILSAMSAPRNASTPTAATITNAAACTGTPGQTIRIDSASPKAYSVTENACDRNRGKPIAPPTSRPRLREMM